ncbi:MAG: hypothetical protein HY976_00565 [Candidatus Kerfeldbacteria bacterium]|nr:hypothetical protein [Candidatus Kerfeldbacteria bacterium]
MTRNPSKLLLAVSIVTTALMVIGAGCSKSSTSDSLSATSETDAWKVTVPIAGNPGVFRGKLETLVIDAEDLPIGYGPYDTNPSSKAEYVKISETGSGMTQQYSPQQLTGENLIFTERMSLLTFRDTSSAAEYYNIIVTAAPLGFQQNGTQGTFTGIGDANFYQTIPYVNQFDAQYNSTTWEYWIVKSNLVVTGQVVAPTSFTVSDMQTLLDAWEQKTSTYIPATDAELQKENDSATSIVGENE